MTNVNEYISLCLANTFVHHSEYRITFDEVMSLTPCPAFKFVTVNTSPFTVSSETVLPSHTNWISLLQSATSQVRKRNEFTKPLY